MCVCVCVCVCVTTDIHYTPVYIYIAHYYYI